MTRPLRPKGLSDFRGDSFDGGEAKRPVPPAGRAHADKRQIGAPDSFIHVRRRRQTPGFHCPLNDLIDLALDDGRLAGANQIDLGRCLVDADHRMAAIGETSGTNGSHIAKSEHTDPHMRYSNSNFWSGLGW